jgi:hypothetical protein
LGKLTIPAARKAHNRDVDFGPAAEPTLKMSESLEETASESEFAGNNLVSVLKYFLINALVRLFFD